MEQEPERSRDLFKFLAVFMMIVFLATFLVHISFSPKAGWRSAELQTAVTRFSENLMRARVEWMRQGEPATVLLTLTDRDNTSHNVQVPVNMSRTGWPQPTQQGVNGCTELWRTLAAAEQLQRELSAEYESKQGKCRFFYAGTEVFHLYPARGQVEKLY